MKVLTPADFPFMYHVVSHPDVWPWIHDDGVKDLGESAKETVAKNLLTDPSFLCVSPNDFTIFALQKMNAVTYEVHTQMLPGGRGKIGFSAGKKTAQWVFDNTPCRKLIGLNPAPNRAVTFFALKVGFKIEGRITKSWLSNGQLYDRIVVGLTEEDFRRRQLCQQQRSRRQSGQQEQLGVL
jgi:hypothetical protein